MFSVWDIYCKEGPGTGELAISENKYLTCIHLFFCMYEIVHERNININIIAS